MNSKDKFIDVMADNVPLSALTKLVDIAEVSKDPNKTYDVLAQYLPTCIELGVWDKVVKAGQHLADNPNGELAFALSEDDKEAALGFLSKSNFLDVPEMDV